MAKSAKFEYYQDHADLWRFRLKAPNGEIIAQGQGYRDHRDCLQGIYLVQMYAADAQIVQVSG